MHYSILTKIATRTTIAYTKTTITTLKRYLFPQTLRFHQSNDKNNNKNNNLLLMLVLVLLSLTSCAVHAFHLDGSQNSFAQFRKWYVGLNGSLELEFKTEQPNGLVLYTDDGGTYDFFELKLVEGALRLRYNLGGGAQIITVGRDLHDGHWHKVQVIRNDEQTSLIVDGVSQSRTTKGKEFQFGKFTTNSDVFVGGMPNWYSTKLALLALPSVIFEPRFRGSIRNLVYADQPGGQTRRQEMKQPRDIKCGDGPCDHGEMPKEKVIRNTLRGIVGSGNSGNMTDACERHDPCQHGGICISTDSGPICECRNLEFDGQYCEKEKAPSEATFRGTQFLSYDLGQTGAEPIVSAQDAITLYFRTRQPNGLLFYTGHGTDYLNLALRDGGVSLTMGLANGKQEMHIKPSKVRFDDHQWHKVTVHRRIQEISSITSFCRLVTVVDDVYTDHSHIAGKFTMLSSSRVYVGGAVNPRALLGARVHNNFVGCLRKVEFSADTLLLNLIDLAKSGSKLIQVAGNVEYQCPSGDPQDPVTFTTRESHLILPPWETGKQSSISFKFRTKEPNGLIILATGSKQPRSKNPVLFAIELLNGHIYIHLDLGSGAAKVRASRRRVDDGDWHDFILRRNGRDAKVSVDGVWNDFRTPGDGTILELDGHMYVGGTGPAFNSINWPPAIWTATLRQGFVGCLRDLVLSGKAVDIAAYARLQDSASVKPSCHIQANVCAGNPCLNSGTCLEGWNRPICDCTATLYHGPTCGRESATLAFNGSQHMTVWLGNGQGAKTQTEELLLRFKTSRPAGLLLMTSAESNSPDRLEIALVAGRIRASVRLSDREKNLLAGQSVLNDNNWHTIRFSRRASNLRLQVDGAPPVRGMLCMYHQHFICPTTCRAVSFFYKLFFFLAQLLQKKDQQKKKNERKVNKLRILDLAVDRDPLITIRGDVQLVTGVLDRNDLQRMQQTPASGYPGAIDDLIFSGAGSGCRGDDEDECTPPFESGSGDDLITPVYIPPTKQTTISQNVSTDKTNGTERACDDEDCLHGSGDYGETTEQFTSTSTAKGSEMNKEIATVTTDSNNRRQQELLTTEQQQTSTTLGHHQTPSRETTALSTVMTSVATTISTTQQTQTPALTTAMQITTVQPAIITSSTTTTSSTMASTPATPSPDVRTTGTERDDTTPYDVVHVFSGGKENENENANIIQHGHHTHTPERPPPPPPPVHETDPGLSYYPLPQPPPYGNNNYRPKGKGGRINSIEEERTAMIIGIVAGILIAVILVILLVLWLKSNGDRNYKTAGEKTVYGSHNANTALLGNASTNGSYHQQRQQRNQQSSVTSNSHSQQQLQNQPQQHQPQGLHKQHQQNKTSSTDHHDDADSYGEQQGHIGSGVSNAGGGGGGGGGSSGGGGGGGGGNSGRTGFIRTVYIGQTEQTNNKDVKEWYV
ncbi:neurexin-3 [Glossina fuscipes]|uniref:Neurexin-3 n=1 Tax=Glossina fuscipes TaxID=7396 RepID=A0A9C6DX11_9MUSC|nr:neurexin-3 [Glossina fuscipes]